MKHTYRKISIITYNNKNFQVFRDEKGRYAFLQIDDEGKYHYPEIDDFVGLANIFSDDIDKKAFFKSNKAKKFAFNASVIAATTVIACSGLLYKQLKEDNLLVNENVTEQISVSDDYVEEDIEQIVEEVQQSIEVEETQEEEETKEEETVDNTIIVEETPKVKDRTVTPDMYHIRDNNMEIDIYNSVALDKFIGKKEVSLEDITEAIKYNYRIDSNLKPIFIDFAQQMMETYPELDMRLFYENMKKIEVINETQESIDQHGDSLAWYQFYDNTIHVNESANFAPNSYDLMVLRHELCHVISMGYIHTDNYKSLYMTIKDDNYGKYIQECVAVALSADPFEDEYDFGDLGYGAMSNEFRAILKAIPNLDMSEIANQNVYGIEDYLDENIHANIDAARLFDLIELQTYVYYHYDEVSVQESDLREIYKYVGTAYTQNVLNPSMSYDEITTIKDNLNELLTREVSNYSCIYTDEIDNIFNQYMIDNNIEQYTITK